MPPDQLLNILLQNVLYIEFKPRHPRKDFTITDDSGDQMVRPRRMICTNCDALLDSLWGRTAFPLYRRPKRYPRFDWKAKGLVVTFDLLWQDFRMIPADAVVITQTVPMEEFYKHFEENLAPMSSEQKFKFMYF